MVSCPRCGYELGAQDKFCSRCGFNFSSSTSESPPSSGIIVVTTPRIEGYKIVRVLDIVHGITARTRGIGGQFVASLQSLVGGEVSAFTSEMEKAKEEALERMKQNARRVGANGIIGVDFETTEAFQTVLFVSVHGTAVILEKEG